MGLFDMLAGGSKKNTSSYGSSSYGSYTPKSNPNKLYQCRYCGKRTNVINPSSLPQGPCHARGKDSRGFFLNHVWEAL